jgi:hypothetical protein
MGVLQWLKNRGRNGWDSALRVREDQSVESKNVHFYNDGLGTKRGGSVAITESGLSGHNAMFEYVPGQDSTAAELFFVDNAGTKQILRSASGASSTSISMTALTLPENIASEAHNVSAVVLNGKLYLAYDGTANRVKVFDPGWSTTAIRFAGVGTPAAATVANTGAGAYAATLRYYKVAYTEQRSSVTVRRSQLSASVSFTPSGAGTAARVTKPAAISEGETHWELYGSADDGTYYLLATTVVGTTTYDDTAAPSTYNTGTAEPTAGANTPFPSVKYLGTDGNRLYGLGVWETTAGSSIAPKNGRFYFGPVLDASGTAIHDDERINNTTTLQGYIDLARNSGAPDRGVTQRPISNVIYAFQAIGVYGLIPTENVTTPYRRVVVSARVGAVSHQSIVIAQDRNGGECAYFLDPTLGPFVVGGRDGLKWCGKDVKDVWDTFNKDATTVPAFGLWYPDRNVVLFWVATSASNTPNKILALDTTEQYVDDEGDLRGGWSVWDGTFAAATCGVMFSNTVATTRSRNRVPYVGLTAGTVLLRYSEAATDDNSTPFQAFVTSGALAQETRGIEIQRAYLRAGASTGVTIQQSFTRNFGDETARTSTVSLTPTGSATKVLKKFEDAALQDGDAVQVTLGDASAVASAWTLESWTAEAKTGAPL